jgi:hypothetical protein
MRRKNSIRKRFNEVENQSMEIITDLPRPPMRAALEYTLRRRVDPEEMEVACGIVVYIVHFS